MTGIQCHVQLPGAALPDGAHMSDAETGFVLAAQGGEGSGHPSPARGGPLCRPRPELGM